MQAYFCQSPVFDWRWGRLDALALFRYSEGEDIKTTFGLKEACMDYDYPLYRPPSEADSVIIQVTLGCAHNQCTFCSMYRGKQFTVVPFDAVQEAIDEWAAACPQARRVFLADGDSMALSTDKLLRILTALKAAFPHLERVSTYARAGSILRKRPEELAQLRQAGLSLLYLGLESGSDAVLQAIRKGESAADMLAAAERAQEAGMALSVMVIMGLAGPAGSQAHAVQTAAVLSQMNPAYIGALTLMVEPGTPLYEDVKAGRFTLLSPLEAVEEMQALLTALESPGSYFSSRHPSNYFNLSGRLNDLKPVFLAKLESLLANPQLLRDSRYRRL